MYLSYLSLPPPQLGRNVCAEIRGTRYIGVLAYLAQPGPSVRPLRWSLALVTVFLQLHWAPGRVHTDAEPFILTPGLTVAT